MIETSNWFSVVCVDISYRLDADHQLTSSEHTLLQYLFKMYCIGLMRVRHEFLHYALTFAASYSEHILYVSLSICFICEYAFLVVKLDRESHTRSCMRIDNIEMHRISHSSQCVSSSISI